MKITGLKRTKRGAYAVFADGQYLFSAQEEALLRSGLRENMETDVQALEQLRQDSEYIFGREYALRLLERRSYTRQALCQKLSRFVAQDSARQVADRLESLGLINDAAYAAACARDLFRLKGYSVQRIKAHLRQKGIGSEEIAAALEQFEQEAQQQRLYELLCKKYLHRMDTEKGRKKAVDAMLRLGYRYGDIQSALRRAEEEHGAELFACSQEESWE